MFEKRRGALVISAATLLLMSVAASAVGATFLYGSDIMNSNEPPQAQIAGLAEGEVLPAGPVKLKGSAADDGAVRAVSVRVDGGSPVPAIPDSTNDFTGWTVSLDLGPGNHTIEVEIVDDLGKTNTTKMSVVATDAAMAMPADKIIEATSPSGALLRYDLPTVQENVRILGGPDCSPASGTRFPIGTTTVTCTALFAGDNTVTADFAVSVRDSRPPTIKAPPDVAAENHGVAYVKVSLGKPTVSDAVDESPTVSNNASSNGFSLGTTIIVWTATDDYGNKATATQKVMVTAAPADSNDNSDNENGSRSTTSTYSGGSGGGGGGKSSSSQEQSDEDSDEDNEDEDGGSNSNGGGSGGGNGGGNEGSNGNEDDSGDDNENDEISVQYTLTINSVDLSGNAIAGISATISSNGSTLQTGGTPLTFAGNSTYTVTVTDPDGVTFDHWDNGATTLARTITLDQNTTIVAHYSIDPVEVPDTTDPSIQITSLDDDSTIVMPDGGLITVEGTASDEDGGSGVEVVEVRVDDGDYVEATPVAEGNWSSWSVTLEVSAGERRLVPRATDNAGNQAWNSIYITVADPPSDEGDGDGNGSSGDSGVLDDFGIDKIYATKSGGNEWYVDMDDPTSDPLFRNLPSMTRQSDGSWQVNGGSRGQVRMEAWSPSGEKWLNVEITGYAKMVSGSNELIQWYSRGGHHTSSNECLGSAVKARLYGDGEARWVKEISHPAYTGNRGSVQATNEPLDDRWIGFKAVMYNFVENGNTYVRMESYIDDDVTGANGNLVIDNDWQLASVVEDRGGWSTGSSDFNSSCSPLDRDSDEQYRQRDEILNMSGGTATQNIAAWRSDDLTWNWKYLSVREIVPPS